MAVLDQACPNFSTFIEKSFSEFFSESIRGTRRYPQRGYLHGVLTLNTIYLVDGRELAVKTLAVIP